MAHDGVYAWDGSRTPTRISPKIEALKKLTYEKHGMARGIVHDRMYDLRLLTENQRTPGTHYQWSFETSEWNTVVWGGSLNLFPLGVWHAPLGHVDAGVRHPIYAQCHLTASNKAVYMGELTTQDDGNNFDCIADTHFSLPPNEFISPQRALFYYDPGSPAGWGTPAISNQNTSGLGTRIPGGGIVTGTPMPGADYSLVAGTFKEPNQGGSDLVVRFSATTQSGGTANRQRFFGGVLEGLRKVIRRGAV
jgi:hypothetical protein